jgi:hypothetical protein
MMIQCESLGSEIVDGGDTDTAPMFPPVLTGLAGRLDGTAVYQHRSV